jgi:hypothetical protein
MTSKPSKDVASVPTFEDVARIIAGANAPPWLVAHLKRWGSSLFLDRHVEAIQPTKAVMKDKLGAVSNAALLLRRALTDAATREFLEIAPLGQIENTPVLERSLQNLAERAERAAASPVISTKAGKTKPGRTRATVPDAYSAKTYCAALIAETWAYLHRRYPASRNRKAAAAADAYWRASGGKATGWGADRLNGWRYHFTKAQAPTTAAVRKECRRRLIEAARWG